jgi:shikimate kinase
MNLVLMGYRCTGKTSVGRILASRLKKPFYDTDELIQASSGKSVREMVEEGGWPFFRREEKQVIAGLSEKDESVIALGGGAVLAEENLRHLKGKGFFIWLKADAETIVKRMADDRKSLAQRPPFSGENLKEETDSSLPSRESIYQRIADRIVDTSGRSIERVAEEVGRIIGEMTKETRSWET